MMKGLDNPSRSLLALIQVRVHSLLERFLNGGIIPSRGRWFYPYSMVSRGSRDLAAEILSLVRSLETAEEGLLPRLGAFARSRGPTALTDLRSMATLLSRFYCDAENLACEDRSGLMTIVDSPPSLDPVQYASSGDASYFRPLLEMAHYVRYHLEEHAIGLYLHGSLSTMDYVHGFSDLDTLLILRGDTASDPQALLATRQRTLPCLPYFRMIDPLQHHGHAVITEQDMLLYPQSFFPFVLFGYSKSLLGRHSKLRFRERDSSAERRTLLTNACNRFVQLGDTCWRPRTLYEFKSFLHGLLMLPTWYLQAIGQYTYKKSSFEQLSPTFEGEGWRAIELATRIRSEWDATTHPARIVEAALLSSWNPFAMPAVCARINRRIPFKLLAALEILVPAASELAQQMLEAARLELGLTAVKGD